MAASALGPSWVASDSFSDEGMVKVRAVMMAGTQSSVESRDECGDREKAQGSAIKVMAIL